MMYIDASNRVLGRVASITAKHLLSGEDVAVLNAEKAVVLGNPVATIEMYKDKRARGDPYHGPFYPKKPDTIFKRTVRGMLPYKRPRGREAFKRLKVFISIPEDMRDKEFTAVHGAANKGERKCITLANLVERL